MLDNCVRLNTAKSVPSDEEVSFHLMQVVSDLENGMEDSVFVQKHISYLLEIAERNNWQTAMYYLSMAQGSFDD
ncbi:MAG: hypothetical protein ACRBCK_07255 [Alphaproteobacteria bacterium]